MRYTFHAFKSMFEKHQPSELIKNIFIAINNTPDQTPNEVWLLEREGISCIVYETMIVYLDLASIFLRRIKRDD